ncbi:MAG: hypothetical protein F6K21_04755 [Symploca sp. SIO2D2]|nr:hypothetical protein [Symploca sp. SIO2D2]
MINRKIKSFVLDSNQEFIFAGNLSGQILSINSNTFSLASQVQAHPGGIIAISAHLTLPYVAVLGMDRSVSIWQVHNGHRLEFVSRLITRDLTPCNDPYEFAPILSVSQALAFHDTERRLLTRSGNAGLLELSFESDELDVVKCVRVHGNYDIVTTRFVNYGDKVLSGSNTGQVALSYHGEVENKWQFGRETIHWFEHLEDDIYLLASDTRCVIRLDISGNHEPVVGPLFTRDDLEHVHYNKISGRAFASSFDRNIYEFDPYTCKPLKVVFSAPFKCRWIKTLEQDPDTMFVQCRNGGLYKVSLNTGQTIGVIKETPPALWTAAQTAHDEIILAGEGNDAIRLKAKGATSYGWTPILKTYVEKIPGKPMAYTKRLVVQETTGTVLFGRTDGILAWMRNSQTGIVCDLNSPVRDLALSKTYSEVFVATEDGRLRKIHIESGQILVEIRSINNQPIWSLAYNDTRSLIAFAEREGWVTIANADKLTTVLEDRDARRAKRMKWLDADRLLVVRSDELYRIDLNTGEKTLLVKQLGNTIEDFIWDTEKRYLVLINYQRNIILCDLETGNILNIAPDQMDYSKGMIWLSDSFDVGYGYDFLTFGRDGRLHLFRIHDEKVLSLGSVSIDR